MYDSAAIKDTSRDAISRRGVGKAIWKRMIDDLIDSERADLEDLRILRRKLFSDPQALQLIAVMQERKSDRIIYLNELLRYSDRESVKESPVASRIESWIP